MAQNENQYDGWAVIPIIICGQEKWECWKDKQQYFSGHFPSADHAWQHITDHLEKQNPTNSPPPGFKVKGVVI